MVLKPCGVCARGRVAEYNGLVSFRVCQELFLRPILAAMLLLPCLSLAVEAAAGFADIPTSHWARVPAQVLSEHRIMAGRTAVSFAGDAALTRYELAGLLSALYRMQGAPPSFLMLGDMPPGHPATLDVQRVLGFGLMGPVSGTRFDGERVVSRRVFVEALARLLEKNGVMAPARRKLPVRFVDVPADSDFGRVLDGLVNRFGVLDVPSGIEFHPWQPTTRYQALGMVMRLMPHLDPGIAAEFRLPASPGVPLSSPVAGIGVEGMGQSPLPASSGDDLKESQPKAWKASREVGALAELVLVYDETLPTQAGSVVGSELRQYSGMMLPAGGLQGTWWEPDWGALLRVRSFYVGVNAPHAGQQVPVDLLDTFVSAAWLWRVMEGPGGALAVGAGGQWRAVYNLSAQLVSQYYLTADKTFLGAGPALFCRWNLAPGWQARLECLTYPLYLQTYNLPAGPQTIQRWGIDGRLGLAFELGYGWLLHGGTQGFMSGAYEGGSLALAGGEFGLSRVF